MIKWAFFCAILQFSIAQDLFDLSALIEQNKSLKFEIKTWTSSYENGFLSKKDSTVAFYTFEFRAKKDNEFVFDVSMDRSIDVSNYQGTMIPKFSDIAIVLNFQGKLVEVIGLEKLENQMHELFDGMMKKRKLSQNKNAIYLKYLLSNPKLLRTILFKHPMKYFSLFDRTLLQNMNKTTDVLMMNPVGKTPLNGQLTKKWLNQNDKAVLLLDRRLEDMDITDKVDASLKPKNTFMSFRLDYGLKTHVYIHDSEFIPKQVVEEKTVKLNGNHRVERVEIHLRSVL